jgi:hypothetical protein
MWLSRRNFVLVALSLFERKTASSNTSTIDPTIITTQNNIVSHFTTDTQQFDARNNVSVGTQYSTIDTNFQFGEKTDNVWYGFISLLVVLLAILIVITLLFVCKTRVLFPTPSLPVIQPKVIRSTLPVLSHYSHRQGQEQKKQIPCARKHGYAFDASEMGNISESNDEDSLDGTDRKFCFQNKISQKTKNMSNAGGIELSNIKISKKEDVVISNRKQNTTESMRPTYTNPVNMDISFSQVSCGRRIGKGGVGSVYAGNWDEVGAVALKKVSIRGEGVLDNLKQEAKMMAALRHKNIVYLFGLAISPEETINGRIERNAYLVMELCNTDVGSLIDNSPKQKERKYDSKREDNRVSSQTHGENIDRTVLMQRIALQVASTMAFVHSEDVIHRDLKPANVLLKNNNIRIADFGLSKALSTDHTHQTMEIGTPAYMAPELIVGIQEESLDEDIIKMPKKLDVYAFGILLWSLYMDAHPYPNLGAFQTIYQVKMMNLRPRIPDTASQAMRGLLQQCWTLKTEERPSFQQINNKLHSLISAGDWVKTT